jgi:hypothetical protein
MVVNAAGGTASHVTRKQLHHDTRAHCWSGWIRCAPFSMRRADSRDPAGGGITDVAHNVNIGMSWAAAWPLPKCTQSEQCKLRRAHDSQRARLSVLSASFISGPRRHERCALLMQLSSGAAAATTSEQRQQTSHMHACCVAWNQLRRLVGAMTTRWIDALSAVCRESQRRCSLAAELLRSSTKRFRPSLGASQQTRHQMSRHLRMMYTHLNNFYDTICIGD